MSAKRPGGNPNSAEHDQLVAEARQHLRDAYNETNTRSTRYAAACEALLCCYPAGLVNNSDTCTTFNWEHYRAAIRPLGNVPNLDVPLAWVEQLLK